MKLKKEPQSPKTAESEAQIKIPKLTLLLSIAIVVGLVIFVIMNVGEAERFAKLLSAAQPEWLLIAVAVQLATYACAGAIWGVVLRVAHHRLSLPALGRLALEKLSVDQVIPSGGMAGNIVVFRAMHNRGIPKAVAMEALLIDFLAYYAAFFVAMMASLIVLWERHAMSNAILYLVAAFSIILVGVPAAIGWLLKHKDRKPPRWLLRIKPIAKAMEMAKSVSTKHVLRASVLLATGALNLSIFVWDSITLWVMMQAIGIETDVFITFVGLVMGTIAGAVSFLPGGIGGFEVGATTALTLLGIPMEAALTGTLLLRGFTLWLPLVPGLWMARRDLKKFHS